MQYLRPKKCKGGMDSPLEDDQSNINQLHLQNEQRYSNKNSGVPDPA